MRSVLAKNMVGFPALGSSCSTRLHVIVRASQLINYNSDDCKIRRSMPSEIDATTLSNSLASKSILIRECAWFTVDGRRRGVTLRVATCMRLEIGG